MCCTTAEIEAILSALICFHHCQHYIMACFTFPRGGGLCVPLSLS